eukprot:gnl/MRDRNA2_/MRDRNA2_112055_c0_seq1.p1 gnl/MRDRNA2_/MRDRNA2_112055_c0~~gnl/MRDRNA2_/MRDRNA2_112055_c0_seq1.p1  ORF type:complete len:424 (+),score=72.28 gnl/MRDRNA2_/MRDRNA2_112055_c0_seq1:80-1351(+)
MTKLDTSSILPTADSSKEACIRQKVLPTVSIEPESNATSELAGKALFVGRWLVVTDLGDCIIDHVVSGCTEDIRKLPLKTLCALVASVFQFVVDISNVGSMERSSARAFEHSSTFGSMHALALSTFKVLVFRWSGFSIAAVVSKSAGFETAVQYKAREIGFALRERIGEALTQVAGQLQSNNDAKMHSFTLESMLDQDEDQNKTLLDPMSQGIAESMFQEKLSKSYCELLRSVVGEPQGPGFRNVSQACICDESGQLLTLLTKQDRYSKEHSNWEHGSKWMYATAQKLSIVPAPAEESIFPDPSAYGTADVLSKLRPPTTDLLSLWLWEENGCTTPVVVGIAGPLRIFIQLWESETELLPTAGNSVVASSLSLKICLLESAEQRDVSLQLMHDLNTAVYDLSMSQGIHPLQELVKITSDQRCS